MLSTTGQGRRQRRAAWPEGGPFSLAAAPLTLMPTYAAAADSATTFPGVPPVSRAAFAASTDAGVIPNHFSASAGRTSSR